VTFTTLDTVTAPHNDGNGSRNQRNTNTMRNSISILAALAVGLSIGTGVAYAEEPQSDWSFNALVGWSWRDIDGTMFSYTPPLAGGATTDSLGLGTSSEPQASFGVRWKQLTVDLVYLPTQYTGSGFLVQGLDFGNGPVIGTTDPITSDIDVAMYLANIDYDLLKRRDMDLRLGVGLGQVELDIAMTPANGNGVNINGNVPFGYLTGTFTKRWNKFAVLFGLQGIGVNIDDYSISYTSVNLAGEYRFYERGRLGISVAGGYRYVDFDYSFDDDTTGVRVDTAFELTGPYIGIRASW